jgi:hypothetical protein
MENPKATNKRSMKEEDGSCLGMSSLTKRQRTGQPSGKNIRPITLKKIAGKMPHNFITLLR